MTNNMITISSDELRRIIREEVANALKDVESDKGTMSAKQVMAYLHCSRVTLWRHKKDGTLVPISAEGKNCLYRAKDVRKFANMD